MMGRLCPLVLVLCAWPLVATAESAAGDSPAPESHEPPATFLDPASTGAPAHVWVSRFIRPEGIDPATQPTLLVAGELFSAMRVTSANGQRFSEAEVDRGEVGLSTPRWGVGDTLRIMGELRLELIRSAQRSSLMGIDGNALVLRGKRAWAGGAMDLGPLTLEMQVGQFMDPWIASIERDFDYRATGQSMSRREFFDSADLGIAARAIWRGPIEAELAMSVTNGEGRSQIEQNDGKNTTAVLSITPLRLPIAGEQVPLRLHLVYRDGSLGAGSARDHRMGAAVTARASFFSAGVDVVRADGLRGQSSLSAQGVGAWLGGHVGHLGAVARLYHVQQDRSRDAATQSTYQLGLYGDVTRGDPTRRARLYVILEADRFGADAGPIPGAFEVADATRGWLLLETAILQGIGR